MTEKPTEKALVIGLWHLGCVTSACLASTGVPVIAYDENLQTIAKLRQGILPVFEPGLAELMATCRAEHALEFSSDLVAAAREATVIYLTHDTPVDSEDRSDLSLLHTTFDSLLPLLRPDTLLLISSQIPVGTCDELLSRLRERGMENGIGYIPENLRLGDAIRCFLSPERVVIGLSSPDLKDRVAAIFASVGGERLFMDLRSAEMAKHALNAYLATMISFSSEVSDVCERSGADAFKVIEALRSEKRVSRHAPIQPGLGFGGGTLARDVQTLRSFGRSHGLATPLFDAVLDVNARRMRYVKERLLTILGGLSQKRIAFFGLTYKAGTSTLRRSLALQVIDQLKGTGAELRAFDPMVAQPLPENPEVRICASAQEAAQGADAIVITTDWPEFRTLDYAVLGSRMRTQVLLDTKNLLRKEDFDGTAVRYYGIGR